MFSLLLSNLKSGIPHAGYSEKIQIFTTRFHQIQCVYLLRHPEKQSVPGVSQGKALQEPSPIIYPKPKGRAYFIEGLEIVKVRIDITRTVFTRQVWCCTAVNSALRR